MPRFPQEIAGLIFRDYENPLVSPNKAGYLLGENVALSLQHPRLGGQRW